ncbi:MAG: hypothetical protein ACRDJW_07255 [Thermomicrobiales bacterium]
MSTATYPDDGQAVGIEIERGDPVCAGEILQHDPIIARPLANRHPGSA